MPCTSAQLKTASKWRDNDRDKFREIIRISRQNNDLYPSKERMRKLKYYYYKKECQRLMNILL